MPEERIADVIVVHSHGPMRLMLHMVLAEEGYAVEEIPTYTAVLRRLRSTSRPMIAVVGNWGPDPSYRAEAEFFAHVAMEPALSRRHHFVLLLTTPEWLPSELDVTLRALGVSMLKMPAHVPELLTVVAEAAGQQLAEVESVG
jgi:hypothetical protein